MKAGLLLLFLTVSAALSADIARPCADRAAVERVYHVHRTGTKPPFEPAMVESLVRSDAKKEAALTRVYGIHITGGMVDAEIRRIDSTTRAPETLDEIRTALGNDSARFGNAVARPILVERLLREHFENDDALHAAQRRTCEAARQTLLDVIGPDPRLAAIKALGNGGTLEQADWVLTPRPPQTKSGNGVYTNVATAQIATTHFPEVPETQRQMHFEDLPGDLQNVLRLQLRQTGDVSAVIESTGAFQFHLATQHTPDLLSVAIFTIPKTSYETWLAGQPES